MEHPAPTVVVDVGSYSTKIGLGSSSTPECVPNLAGTFKYRRALLPVKKSADVSISPDSLVVGKAVERYRGLLRLTYPVEYGTVKHWPAMEAILHQAKQSLHHPSAETTSTTASWSAQHNADSYVALVEAPVASRKQRQRLVECLLEGGAAGEGPRGIFCGVAPLLALYSTGSMTGLALEVGEGVVSTAAAVQGFAITAAMQREDVGGATGSALTTHLERLMRQHGTWQSLAASTTTTGAGSESEEERIRQGRALGDLLGTTNGREVVRGVKERCCRVSPTPLPNLWSCLARSTHAERGGSTAELHAAVQLGACGEAARPQLHRLPDGTEILVGSEAMYAPEVLFNPALIGGEGRSISEMLHATWQQADLELRPQLLENVVLTGGTSLVTGFGARVLNELLQLAPREQKVRVVAPAERGHAAWTGAAMLSQLSTFATDMVVSRAEYLEHGEAILQSRLFA